MCKWDNLLGLRHINCKGPPVISVNYQCINLDTADWKRQHERQASLGIMVAQLHEGPPKNLSDHHGTIVLRGLRWILNCSPIMPRDVSLSDSRCYFFEPSLNLSPESDRDGVRAHSK